MPHLNTFETIMKVSQLMVQGLKDKSSQLRQLPHITDDILKHFKTKKVGERLVNCILIILSLELSCAIPSVVYWLALNFNLVNIVVLCSVTYAR